MKIRSVVLLCLGLGMVTQSRASNAKWEEQLRERSRAFAATWGTHDSNRLANFWGPDGDLINPLGNVARGRSEIASLFASEHATVFRQSTFEILSNSIRFFGHDLAFADWDMVVHNMLEPGSSPHDFRYHASIVFRHHGQEWWIVSFRAYQFLTLPVAGSHQ